MAQHRVMPKRERNWAVATLKVGSLDEEVVEKLKRRAAENNRSLESEARHILVMAAEVNEESEEVDMKEKIKAFRARARELRKLTRGTNQVPSEVIIRQARDFDHGPAS